MAKIHQFFSYSPWNHYFEYGWYNLELLRLLGSSAYGGVEAGEFLETIASIQSNDMASWKQNWLDLAERTHHHASHVLMYGHTANARGAFLRATNYYRCAQYLWPAAIKEEQEFYMLLYQRSQECFHSAMDLAEHHARMVEIPHRIKDGRTVQLPGWIHLPAEFHTFQDRKTPILICFGGADSTLEELYFLHVAEGPALGYAVLTVEAPGQGMPLRKHGARMQPEGEMLVDSVLNFLTKLATAWPQANLDTEAFAITGQSFGGYLALRGAAHPRIKACVAVDSFYDLWDVSAARMPPGFNYLFENVYVGDSVVNWMVRAHGRHDLYTSYQFALAQSMFGTPDAGCTLREMKRYTFKAEEHGSSGFLERIRCPVLVTGATADPVSFLPEESVRAIVKGLVNVDQRDIEVWLTASYSEGGAQAKSGAWSLLQHRTYRFLDQKLGICRVGAKSLHQPTMLA